MATSDHGRHQTMGDITPDDLGCRAQLLVDKHAEYIRSFSKIWENTDKIEFVATEHFWMSGMYWGLTAMSLLGKLEDMDEAAITSWVLSCQHECGGFGGSSRNDPHLLYTLSAVQILALYDKLHLVDAQRIAA
ncbi:geranylgeranyl transferase type-2 subunit beta, partial [Haematococcus lacustris]